MASFEILAAIEASTSAREAILPAVNGPCGGDNPARQRSESALSGEEDSHHVIQDEPGD